MFFDSHCHLNDPIFNRDFRKVINQASKKNVLGMVVVGVDKATSTSAVDLAINNDMIYASIGFHPHNASKCNKISLKYLEKISKHSKVIAWGEIGLDFNRMYSSVKEQEFCFIEQMAIADNLKLPIIIHERDSKGRLINLLNTYSNPDRVAVIHCFSGDYQEMLKYLSMGFYLGITGIVTMLKRGKYLRELIKEIPSDRLLIETDSPYLVPAPYRNKMKRNEPAMVEKIFLKLAEVRQEDPGKFTTQILKNTNKFFKLNLV